MSRTDNTVIFYSFAASGASLISPPQPNLEAVTVPLPNAQDPLHPTSQTIQSYYWWDPFITIRQS